MNLPPFHATRNAHPATRATPRESGSTVIVIIALLSILLLYMAYNLKTLANLGRELRLLERQQIRRLQGPPPRTNAPPAIIINTNAVPPARTN